MMNKIILFLSICFIFTFTLNAQDVEAEKEAIKKVIVYSYVGGIFNEGSAEAVKKGWHYDCDIVVFQQGRMIQLPAYSWVERLEKNPEPLHPGTEHEFTAVHVAGNAGLAVVEIYQEDKHIYTDFMNLYKFEDGWKIVTKTYYAYPKD